MFTNQPQLVYVADSAQVALHFLPHCLLPMSLHHTVKGQCGSCGKGNRSLLPPEADGHSYCVVCSLLVSIQQMTTRIDSETDHRIVRLYQDLQAAAQRFWSTPHCMVSHQPPTSTMEPQPGATTYSNPHATVAFAPAITVDTPIYNVFVPGTEHQTRHFAQIGIPTYWQVTPRAGKGPTPPPLFCFPTGSDCDYYHHHPIGSPCPNMGFSGCARTRVRRCRGSLGFDLRSSMSIRPLWPVGANIRP